MKTSYVAFLAAFLLLSIPAARAEDSLISADVAEALTDGSLIDVEVAEALTEPSPEPEPVDALQRLEDILEYTYTNNPSLLASRAELKATQEELPQAESNWRPDIGATASVLHSDIDGGTADGSTSKEASIDIEQPLWRGGRTVAEIASVGHTIAARRIMLGEKEQQVIEDAAIAYVDTFLDKALLALAENNKDVIVRQLEATQARFDAGDLTKTDVSQAQARLARAEADLVTASGNLQTSMAVFRQVTGLVAGNVGRPRLNLPLPETSDEAIALAERYNPQIRASLHLHEASERDIQLIAGEMMPEISLSGGVSKEYDPQPGLLDETSSRSIGITASIPLYAGGATISRVRQARYTANQKRNEIDDVRSSVRKSVVSSWEGLMAARAEIRSREAQAEAARLAAEGVREESEAGTRTILDVLDAEQEYMDARTALESARRNEIVATFSLARTLGMLTPAILGFMGYEKSGDNSR